MSPEAGARRHEWQQANLPPQPLNHYDNESQGAHPDRPVLSAGQYQIPHLAKCRHLYRTAQPSQHRLLPPPLHRIVQSLYWP